MLCLTVFDRGIQTASCDGLLSIGLITHELLMNLRNIVPILNTFYYCLLFGLLSLVHFLTIDARMGRVIKRGILQKTPGLPCTPTILPSVGLHAG